MERLRGMDFTEETAMATMIAVIEKGKSDHQSLESDLSAMFRSVKEI